MKKFFARIGGFFAKIGIGVAGFFVGIFNKITGRNVGRKITAAKKVDKAAITADKIKSSNIEEFRKSILKKGRKHKRPMFFARHRIVKVAVIVGVTAIMLTSAFCYATLYVWKSTGDFAYTLTRFLPLEVARVDGRGVLYRDYLMFFRSGMRSLEASESDFDSFDEEDRNEFIAEMKRTSLHWAITVTHAMRVAEERGIEVTSDDVAEEVKRLRTVNGSVKDEAVFDRMIRDMYGLSRSEYERVVRLSLVRKRVAVEIDTEAIRIVEQIQVKLPEVEGDFQRLQEAILAGELGDVEKMMQRVIVEDNAGFVPKMNVDGGRALVAAELEKGQISEPFVSDSGDCYYIVKLIDKTETQVSYVSIRVNITALDRKIESLDRVGSIRRFINLD